MNNPEMTLQTEDQSVSVIDVGSEVIMHFTLTLDDGSAADSTRTQNKPAKFVVGDGSLTSGFEEKLLGMKAGEKGKFKLPPEQAFGHPNPDNFQYMERSRFSGIEIEEGTIVAFDGPSGEIPGVVRQINGDSVTLDFNHPLAGQHITFEVEVLDVKTKLK